jgi:RNA polymerase sigma factor (sigma-70 family)
MIDKLEGIVQERLWLVQWCTRLTGTPDKAEDLAHDTVVEALRHEHKLIDPAGRRAWLAVIARYVYWRWRRKQWRDAQSSAALSPEEEGTDAFPISEVLERKELRETLEKALRRIPPATQKMMIAHYFQHASYRTIAETSGVSEDAVSMRLSRGRRQLRHILTTEFAGELRAYRSELPPTTEWITTESWCSMCGQHQLLAQLPPYAETVTFCCPGCHPDQTSVGAAYPLSNRHFARLFGAVRRPSVVMHRAAIWAHTHFHEAIVSGKVPCTHCRRDVALQTPVGDSGMYREHPYFLYLACDACGTTVSCSLEGYLLTLPEVQAFKAHHKRIYTVPGEQIEVEGVEAQVTVFKSMTSAAVLEVIAPRRMPVGFHPITIVDSARRV